jgi:hypothetical protein
MLVNLNVFLRKHVVCHVNKNIVDDLNIADIVDGFGKRSAIRVGLFGSFDSLKLYAFLQPAAKFT